MEIPDHKSSYMPVEMHISSKRYKRDTNSYSPHYDSENENCVTQYVTVCPEDENYEMAMPGYGMPSGYGTSGAASSGKKFGKSREKRFVGSFLAGGLGAGAGLAQAKTGAVVSTLLPPLLPLPLLGLLGLRKRRMKMSAGRFLKLTVVRFVLRSVMTRRSAGPFPSSSARRLQRQSAGQRLGRSASMCPDKNVQRCPRKCVHRFLMRNAGMNQEKNANRCHIRNAGMSHMKSVGTSPRRSVGMNPSRSAGQNPDRNVGMNPNRTVDM